MFLFLIEKIKVQGAKWLIWDFVVVVLIFLAQGSIFWDLSSLTRNGTLGPRHWKFSILTISQPGNSPKWLAKDDIADKLRNRPLSYIHLVLISYSLEKAIPTFDNELKKNVLKPCKFEIVHLVIYNIFRYYINILSKL